MPVMPKETRSRERDNGRNTTTGQLRSVEWDGVVRGPELPDCPGGAWPEMTVQFYDAYRRSPRAADFAATDWDQLLIAALLHSELWGNQDITPTAMSTLAAKVTAITAKLGATVYDRQMAGYRDVTGQQAPTGESPRRGPRVDYSKVV